MSSMPEPVKLDRGDNRYPSRLLEHYGSKAPEHLFCLGNLRLFSAQGVGFCGSRKSSAKGLETVSDCASQAAAARVVVVSGNAAGVDQVAHYQALKSSGSTILVLPEGIENFRIRKELKDVWDWQRVLVVSQFKPTAIWRAYQAMERNKTIIGLSGAMIVIEAGETGGTLAAGQQTLKANLPLFVAQYENEHAEAKGNLLLIEAGGVPLCRLKSTERANMRKVWDSFLNSNDAVREPRLL